MADEKAEEGDAPVEERRFVRDVASVVDRQNPVAMFQHGVGNHPKMLELMFLKKYWK